MVKAKGINKIAKKILADAEAEAKKTKNETRKEIASIKARHKKQRDDYEKRFEERTETLIQGLKQKNLAQARLDTKKSLLRERESIIENLVQEVVNGLDHKSKAYERFLKTIIDENKQELKGTLTIICCKKDVALVKQLAKGASVETRDMRGGLILEDSKGKRVDESIDAVVNRKRDDIRQAAAAIIE